MKKLLFAVCMVLTLAVVAQTKTNTSKMSAADKNNIYQFKIRSIDGSTIDFSKFKGKKILLVNTASKCGFTKQYGDLEKLYKENMNKLVIVGFPSGSFDQELSSDSEILEFCKARHGVTFPLTTKIAVKGSEAHPIYQWLTSKEKNGVLDAKVAWNFNKFLIDEQGKLIEYYPSKVLPQGEEITKYLK